MAMTTVLGPMAVDKIILCAADAGRAAQSATPEAAWRCFPGAPWVEALGATAEKVGTKFLVLTTGHGLVRAKDVIAPYDLPLSTHGYEATVYWRTTVPAVLRAHKHALMIFYAGGSPRDLYLEHLLPLLRPLGISVLTFGRPSMVDVDQVEGCVAALRQGTTLEKIAGRLKHPNRLQFYYHA
jgi:hypothetical protein